MKPSSSSILEPLKPFTLFIELAVVIVVAIYATSPFLDLSQNTRLGGGEMEYLTRTAFSFSTLLPQKGYIPLWQPYLESGDPLLENPVSFAFNIVASVPSYLFGLYQGIKITLLLVAILSGIGGWCLGRVLGLGTLARLVIACLFIGKGNLHAYLVEGHFPLTLSQAFFPWVFVAVVAIMNGHRRWAVGLLMVSFVFTFWSGVPWYPPAIALSIGILTLSVMVRRVPSIDPNTPTRWQVQWKRFAGVALGTIATFFFSAALMYPLLTKADNIGSSGIFEDHRADLVGVFELYFSSVKDLFGAGIYPQGYAYGYYSYISPVWYALLCLVLVVLAVLVTKTAALRGIRFFWGFLALFIFTTLWGAGQNPIIELFYRTIPYADQFRYVHRVFAVSSMALIVLLAMGVEVIWRGLVQTPAWSAAFWEKRQIGRKVLRWGIGISLFVLSGIASYDVVRQWHVTWGEFFTQPEDVLEDTCITWLRTTYPDRPLSVWTLAYKNIYTYLRNQVRHGYVASDFYHARPVPATIFQWSLLPNLAAKAENLPEFAMGVNHFDAPTLAQLGYVPMPESVNRVSEGRPCMYRRDGAFSYAWTATLTDLNSYRETFPVTATTPISHVERDYDRIGLIAQARADEQIVVTVQESAYPGWQVFVNNEPATLESVGGQIGVLLPLSDEAHSVVFRYLPQRFFIGARITLVTALVAALYLLRIDRLFLRLRQRGKPTPLNETIHDIPPNDPQKAR